MAHLLQRRIFQKKHQYNFHVPLGKAIMQKFKKSLEQIQSPEDPSFLGPKMAH